MKRFVVVGSRLGSGEVAIWSGRAESVKHATRKFNTHFGHKVIGFDMAVCNLDNDDGSWTYNQMKQMYGEMWYRES